LVAAQYYLWRTHGDLVEDPRALLEFIAVANFCKFCINGTKNRDYVGNIEKVRVSIPYVCADLRILRPAVVVLPKRAWKHAEVQKAIVEEARTARFLPLPQFNPRVVHSHLRKHESRATDLEEDLRDTILPAWIAQMRRYATGAPYRFLVEMDEVLEKTGNA
jgi:hypothetical protein